MHYQGSRPRRWRSLHGPLDVRLLHSLLTFLTWDVIHAFNIPLSVSKFWGEGITITTHPIVGCYGLNSSNRLMLNKNYFNEQSQLTFSGGERFHCTFRLTPIWWRRFTLSWKWRERGEVGRRQKKHLMAIVGDEPLTSVSLVESCSYVECSLMGFSFLRKKNPKQFREWNV